MKILVIGAGAVGGYFGARLTAAGRDVTFLVRDGRAGQLRRDALRVVTPHGDFSVVPKMISAAELAGRRESFDLILVSTKAYSLAAAMENFAPAVGAGTMILPLLNGMKHLDSLDARFGEEHVLGGSTRISATLDEDGRVVVMEKLHDLVFGERDRSVSARIEAVAAVMSGAGFDDKLSDDVLQFMWQKWTLLSSLAAITCMLGGSIGDVAAVPGGKETARAMALEAAAISAANGYEHSAEYVAMITKRLTEAGSKLTASMYRDMTSGAPVEAEQILGDLLERGRAHRVEAPLLTASFAKLSVYEARRLAGSAEKDSSGRG